MKYKKTIPPKLAQKFLRCFLKEELAEEVEGDLEEQFYSRLEESTIWKAKLNYWYEVINYLRPFSIKNLESPIRPHFAMFNNYFLIGWRSLLKQKVYSLIKIGGFSIGIAACLLIFLFIRQDLSYDRYYQNGDRIYRIFRESSFNGESGKGAHFPSPFAAALLEEIPEIEQAGRYNSSYMFGAGSNEVRRADQQESSHEDRITFADQSLLQILQTPFIYGNPKSALADPDGIVITKSKADKYFPDENPIGKILIFNNDDSNQFKVSGVIKDFPSTSHFQFDFLISLAEREFYTGELTNWKNDNYITYIGVKPGTNIADLEDKFSLLIDKYFLPPRLEAGSQESINWVKSFHFGLQPVKDIHLNVDEVGDNLAHGDIRFIWLFGAIASFILIIACINFINLSTARSANRAREVGLRKVVGSNRSGLVKQFLTESILFSFLAVLLGSLLAALFLPYFNTLLGKSLTFPTLEWWFMPILIAGTLIIGIIAGIYPSFYLSSFQPINVLKGNVSRGTQKSTLRSSLVVFQFTVSIILIIGTLIINKQMDYILHKKLGFEKDQVIVIQGTHTLENKLEVFKNELVNLPEVESVSISSFLPVEGFRTNNGGWLKEGMQEDDAVSGQHWSVDQDYIETLGLKIKQGRDFHKEVTTDSQSVIINESLAKQLNFEHPIGEQISDWSGKWTIIGVVEDFHFESMKQAIRPLGMYLKPSVKAVSVKVSTVEMPVMIQELESLWKEFSPNQAFRYTFLDLHYEKMYQDVERIGTMFSVFALLAIVVACLGLFALSSFLVEQRAKEISIRLILGASISSIFRLLTHNFVVLVFISILIAVPIALLMMQKWLEDYAYRITIGIDTFLLAGFIAVFIALSTISYQAIKASLVNPVKNLKSE